MKCSDCTKWLVAETTSYDDGSVIDQYRAPEGHGKCLGPFAKETKEDFFCGDFVEGHGHVTTRHKTGEPWQHHSWGSCPDCNGLGQRVSPSPGPGPLSPSMCGRCCGTGRVRYYEDGYIGEEKTRLHPKEKELKKQADEHLRRTGRALQHECAHCKRKGDMEWTACPWCGIAYYEAPAVTEVVAGNLETLQ